MEFWKEMEREKKGGPSSSTKALTVPKTAPKFGAGESVKETQTCTNTGNASEVGQKRKAGKKWSSINGPPSNAPSHSKGALRPQSTSAFESTATWYTDPVPSTRDDSRWSVKAELAPLSLEKKRPQWHADDTTTAAFHAPTVSVTAADSPSETRRDLQTAGSTVLRTAPSLLPSPSNGHTERSALSPSASPRRPPPPPPPPPYRSTHGKNATSRNTSPDKTLEAPSSRAQLPARALSPSKNKSKMMGGLPLSPTQSMGKLNAMPPSLLSARGPKSSSPLRIHTSHSTSELHSPARPLSPISPRKDLFVSAAQESIEEVAFSAMLQRWFMCMLFGVVCCAVYAVSTGYRVYIPLDKSMLRFILQYILGYSELSVSICISFSHVNVVLWNSQSIVQIVIQPYIN